MKQWLELRLWHIRISRLGVVPCQYIHANIPLLLQVTGGCTIFVYTNNNFTAVLTFTLIDLTQNY